MVHTDIVGHKVTLTLKYIPCQCLPNNRFVSASFLHACSPPIVHGNLTWDTIFIQHNGLIKIGSGKID